MYNAGNFARAALEYERVIFGTTDPNTINTALFGRARSFKQMQQFANASAELRRIIMFALSPEELFYYFYEKILCYYLGGSFYEARGAIEEMHLFIEDYASCNPTLILQVLVYNELQQWDQARIVALRFAYCFPEPQRDSLKTIIEQMYSPRNLPNLKSRRMANVLAFIPGLAHIYTGNWVEGMVSFLLNSAALTFGVYEVLNGFFITGYLVGAGILSATYFGGFGRAAFLVDKYNHNAIRSFNNNVRQNLLAPHKNSSYSSD